MLSLQAPPWSNAPVACLSICPPECLRKDLVVRLQLRPPALSPVKLLGPVIVDKHGESQAPKALPAAPILRRPEKGSAHTLPFCLPRHGQNRDVAVSFVREIVTSTFHEEDAHETTVLVLGDEQCRASGRAR